MTGMTDTASLPPSHAPARQAPASGVAALVSGILGVTVLPLIGAVLALVFGYQSQRETAAEPDRYSDELGRIGRVLGWVGLVLAAVGLVAVVAAVLFLMPVAVELS
jgi:hypothetical protein